jgi:hypothetical protein
MRRAKGQLVSLPLKMLNVPSLPFPFPSLHFPSYSHHHSLGSQSPNGAIRCAKFYSRKYREFVRVKEAEIFFISLSNMFK